MKKRDMGDHDTHNSGPCAFVKHLPHNVFSADLVRFFGEFNVDESKVHPSYTETFRLVGWYVEFPSWDHFTAASAKTKVAVLGARAIRLEERSRRYMEEDLSRGRVEDWRGKSVVLSHLPHDIGEPDLERFFQGYSIAGNGIRVCKTMLERKVEADLEPSMEVRAAVKFTTGLEAMRAWREKHLEIMDKRPVRVALLR